MASSPIVLDPSLRSNLASIVDRMSSSGESDASIREVVQAFKQKYAAGPGGAVPDAGAQMRNSVLNRVSDLMSDNSVPVPVHPYGGAPTIQTPVTNSPLQAPQRGAVQMVDGAAQTTRGTARDIAGGVSKVLRGGMEVLSPALGAAGVAAPVETAVGLASGTAAQKGTEATLKAVGVPDEYADLAGDVVGLAGGHAGAKYIPGAVSAGIEALPGARNSAADALRASAEKNIATAINPTTKVNKSILQNKIAPGMIDRGITATSLADLQTKAQAGMEQYGQIIDDIFDQHAEAGTKISPKPILEALDNEKQAYTVAGVPINEPYVNRIDALQDQLQKVSDANGGAIPLADLRSIRQINDEIVKQSKGGFALPPDAQSAVNAAKVYGNAIRSTFADQVPELVDPNREFNFYSDLDKVVGDSLLRKTGQRAPLTQKILEGTGTVVGGQLGGGLGAIVGKEAGATLGKLQNGALWNTLSAQVKTRIADLLASGYEAGAISLAKRNGVFPQEKPGVAPGVASEAQSNGVSSDGRTTSDTGKQSVPAAATVGAGAATGRTASGGEAGAGAATTIVIPGRTGGYAANYGLKELADLNASHNGLTFAPNSEYQLKNDRNYANAVNQGKIVSWSSPIEFDPKFHVTDNPDATNGPLITDSQGNVIGGNGRKMILDRVYAGNPKGAAAYQAMLEQKAGQFGLDPQQVGQMKRPVLVREIPDSEFLKPGQSKQNAVTDFNKKGTAELTPGERAIADSRRVSTDTLDDIAGRLDQQGPEATVADILRGKAGGEVLNKLVSDGVVSPQERAAFMTSDGELTEAGRERVSQLMLGRFFRDPGQLDSIARSVRNQVERIAAPLAQVESKPDWNLSPHLADALELLERAQKMKIGNVDDFIAQDGLFGGEKYSPEAQQLARALKSMKAEELKTAARQYAHDASYTARGNSLFGDTPTPAKSFGDAFGKPKPPKKNHLAS